MLAAGRACSAVPRGLCGEALASLAEDPARADQAHEYAICDDDDQG